MDYAFGDGFVQLARSSAQFFLGLVGITRSNSFAGAADVGLQLRLNGLITLTALLVRENALLLRLDVCQLISLSVIRTCICMSDMDRVGRGSAAGGLEVWGTLALPNGRTSRPTGAKSSEKLYQSFAFHQGALAPDCCEPARTSFIKLSVNVDEQKFCMRAEILFHEVASFDGNQRCFCMYIKTNRGVAFCAL